MLLLVVCRGVPTITCLCKGGLPFTVANAHSWLPWLDWKFDSLLSSTHELVILLINANFQFPIFSRTRNWSHDSLLLYIYATKHRLINRSHGLSKDSRWHDYTGAGSPQNIKKGQAVYFVPISSQQPLWRSARQRRLILILLIVSMPHYFRGKCAPWETDLRL